MLRRPVTAAVTSLGLIGLLGGTVYTLVLRPKIEDAVVGPSRLTVSVLKQGQFTPQGLANTGLFLFADGGLGPNDMPTELRHWSAETKRNAWSLNHGAVPGETLSLRLSIRAAGERPVILHGLRVDVIKRSAPLSGWFVMPDQGCGGQEVRSINFFLDRDPIVPTLTDISGKPKPFNQAFRVSQADPEVFEIHATSYAKYVEFRLVLLYDSETGTGEYPVNDGDRPFALTGLAPYRAQAYVIPYSENPEPNAQLERAPERDPEPSSSVGGC